MAQTSCEKRGGRKKEPSHAWELGSREGSNINCHCSPTANFPNPREALQAGCYDCRPDLARGPEVERPWARSSPWRSRGALYLEGEVPVLL